MKPDDFLASSLSPRFFKHLCLKKRLRGVAIVLSVILSSLASWRLGVLA